MRLTRLFGWILVFVASSILILPSVPNAQSAEDTRSAMRTINDKLALENKNFRVEVVEYCTVRDEIGQTVYFDDRGKQMEYHFVPGDPNRGGRTDITWLSDQIDGAAKGLSVLETQEALGRAMATWNEVTCSAIPLDELPDNGMDWGYVQWLYGYGGVPGWLADVAHCGWLPGGFFDLVFGPGARDVVAGVAFTLVWIDDGTGEPTDIDNNHKMDVAFREIYYNNWLPWGIDTDWPIDVESIVLHEAGHGLSQGHFGKLFQTDANGKFHFSPRAVMNAGYTGLQQDLSGTDTAGHCSIWAHWPNR